MPSKSFLEHFSVFGWSTTRWPSPATRYWRTCHISNIWEAGCNAKGATRQTWVIDWIALSAFSSLGHLWADHRLSRRTKLRLYRVCVCSSLTHTAARPGTLNRTVMRSINGFNSRCLHVMTGEHHRETETAPAYDLVLAVRRRRLRYLVHVLRMPADRLVRCALLALVSESVRYPTGSLFASFFSGVYSWLVMTFNYLIL